MKTTPFQQLLKSEMSRLESVIYCSSTPIGGQLALNGYRPTKTKHFLLQFLGYKISF